MNGLDNLLRVLREGDQEITVEPDVREKALVPLRRMLEFTAARQMKVASNA